MHAHTCSCRALACLLMRTFACLSLCLCCTCDRTLVSCNVGLQGSVETYVETYASLVRTCTCVSVFVVCPCGSRIHLSVFCPSELMRHPLSPTRSRPRRLAPGLYGRSRAQTHRFFDVVLSTGALHIGSVPASAAACVSMTHSVCTILLLLSCDWLQLAACELVPPHTAPPAHLGKPSSISKPLLVSHSSPQATPADVLWWLPSRELFSCLWLRCELPHWTFSVYWCKCVDMVVVAPSNP